MQKKRSAKKQTQVKDLPKKELKLNKEDLKKVRGGSDRPPADTIYKLPTISGRCDIKG